MRIVSAVIVAGMCTAMVAMTGCSPHKTGGFTSASPSASTRPSVSMSAAPSASAQTSASLPAEVAAVFSENIGDFTRSADPAVDSSGDLASYYEAAPDDKTKIRLNVSVGRAEKYGIEQTSDVQPAYQKLFETLDGKNFHSDNGVYCASDMTDTGFDATCVGVDTHYVMVVFGKATLGETDGASIRSFAAEFWKSIKDSEK